MISNLRFQGIPMGAIRWIELYESIQESKRRKNKASHYEKKRYVNMEGWNIGKRRWHMLLHAPPIPGRMSLHELVGYMICFGMALLSVVILFWISLTL